MEKLVAGFVAIFTKLTLSRVILALLLSVGGVCVYGLWETRAQWVPTLLQSQVTLVGLSAFMVATLIGFVWDSLQRRLDQRTDNMYSQLRTQAEDTQKALESERAERRQLHSIVVAQSKDIATLTAMERECQRNYRELQRRMNQQTGPGGLTP